MRGIILAIVLVLLLTSSFLVGCKKGIVDDVSTNGGADGVTDGGSDGVVEPKEDGPGEYFMGIDDDIKIDGKVVKFLNLDKSGEVLVSVGGTEWVIYGTNSPEIINGIELKVKKVQHSTNIDEIQITLDVKSFERKQDEYLLVIDKGIYVNNKQVILTDVDSNDRVKVRISNEGEVIILKGETKRFAGFDITNTRPFHRPIRYEKYAVLTIV